VRQERAGGQPAPCHTSNQSANPEKRFQSPSIKAVLDAIIADANGRHVCASLAAGNAIMYYQQGTPFGMRTASATATHYSATVANAAMLVWDRITARQGQNAEIDFRLIIGRQSSAVDPMVWTGTAVLPAHACDNIYTLGLVRIEGTEVVGIQEWTYDNRVEIKKVASKNEKSPGYVAVDTYAPMLTIRTNAMSEIATHWQFGGKAYTACDAYLIRAKDDEMQYTAGELEHIHFAIKPGLMNVSKVDGSPSDVTIELMPNMDSGDATYRTHVINTASSTLP